MKAKRVINVKFVLMLVGILAYFELAIIYFIDSNNTFVALIGWGCVALCFYMFIEAVNWRGNQMEKLEKTKNPKS